MCPLNTLEFSPCTHSPILRFPSICSQPFLFCIFFNVIVSLELHLQVYRFYMISTGVLKDSLDSSYHVYVGTKKNLYAYHLPAM